MIEFKLVSCTKRNERDRDHLPIWENLYQHKLIRGTDATIFFENAEGLSKRYNEAIETELSHGTKYLVFVHDDVLITDAFWREKLREGFDKFDVIGVAGSSNFSVKRTPVCWSNCPQKDWAGAVEHPVRDKSGGKTGTYVTSFGPTPKEVLVVDGLFMAVNLMKIGNVRFDEKFDFDFYDADFCINCVKSGLKLGVVNVMCYHDSHGAGIRSERYENLQKEFIAKWSVKK